MDTDLPRPVDTLGMDAEEMKRLGYWVVDQVVNHWQTIAHKPVISAADINQMIRLLGEALPEQGTNPIAAMSTLVDVVLANMQHNDHPRYFSRIPGPSSFAGVLGDWLTTGFNGVANTWNGCSGPTAVELIVCEWFCREFGFKDGSEGVVVSGGSTANLLGLMVAKQATGNGIYYLCDQTHQCLIRNLRSIGVKEEQIRIIPSNLLFQMSVDALTRALAADRAAGLTPSVVIATVGTTNSGAVDDLVALSAICKTHQLWLHVDGAYGAPAVLCSEGKKTIQGLHLVDSLAFDPHKWLFQPYDIGIILIQHKHLLKDTFFIKAEYLVDVAAGHEAEVDLYERTLELTRRARANKLWLTIQIYGMEKIRQGIARGIEMAEIAEKMIRQDSRWTIMTRASLAIVTFRLKKAAPGEHAGLAERLKKDGFAAVTHTHLVGKSVLRLCTLNPRTTIDDLEKTLAFLGVKLAARGNQ